MTNHKGHFDQVLVVLDTSKSIVQAGVDPGIEVEKGTGRAV